MSLETQFRVIVSGQREAGNIQLAEEGLKIIIASLEQNNGLWREPTTIEMARANAESSDIKGNIGIGPKVLRITAKTSRLKEKLEAALKIAGVLDGLSGIFDGAVLQPSGFHVIMVNQDGLKQLTKYLETYQAPTLAALRS